MKLTAESVIDQDLKDFEHIIKDGGSTDGSLEPLLSDPRFSDMRVVRMPDTGIFEAMNQALEMATGEYVLFLNAGDIFKDASVLGKLKEHCAAKGAPDLIYTDYMVSDLMRMARQPKRLTDRVLFRTMLCHQTCYVKRECYDRLGKFDTSLKVEGDYDFLLRLIVLARSSYRHIPFVSVIFKSGGWASKNMDVGQEEVRRLRKKYFTGLKAGCYGALYGLTLPRLRNAMLSSPDLRLFRKIYFSSVNAYYRIANRLNREA